MTNDNFYGYKCRNFHSLRKGDCDTSEPEMMGHYVSMDARGKYYVEVENSSPYATGPKDDECD